MYRLFTNSIGVLFLCATCYSLSAQLPIHLEYRNIGPAQQGGRIVDIEARVNDFTKVYVASASGGVWQSENAGTTWKPIFDDYETASIGDIALDPSNERIIWVGTGEANNRNSVSWGNGVYKSEDGGETFTHQGLASTHQIARVLVHPEASDDVCVCAIGHLWGYSGERGLFQTKNGGKSWAKLTNGLPDDGKTGCTDLVRDPKKPNVLYAAFYERLRQPWHFHSGGSNGGIYKSTNNGKSWKKLTSGLPAGPTGRIGLAIYPKNPKILMALVEAEKTETLAEPGSGVYRSEDGGASWRYINMYNNRPFYYSQIRIDPHDDQRVYVLTTRFMVSEDGGKTLRNGSEDQEVHGDFHALWHDPAKPGRYYLGADKGLSITHDYGQYFQLIDNLPIGQFYRVHYDMRDPYYVYGGLQDNGSYATASFTRDARGILADDNWKMHWGDGQDPLANPNDWTDMYSSMENGSFFKYNPQTREIDRISPTALNTVNYHDYFPEPTTENDSEIRWNWSAPMVMSPHDPQTIFVAGNHLYRTRDKGQSWMIISPDLTTNDDVKRKRGESGGITPDNTGAETHCAVHTLSVSPIDERIIWVGTDDGNVQVSRTGGQQWQNVRVNIPEVPEGLWVSRVEASHFVPGRAYVSFDGHRSDEFGTWLLRTDDFGVSWRRITNGFTTGETVRVVREDHRNTNLLFAGTETGVWMSLDGGSQWQRLKLNMPTVSVYDLKIHPRDNDLIVGTHGRSIWILDDISPLQQLAEEIADTPFYLFEQQPSTLWRNISRGGQRGHFWFAGDNPKTIDNTSTIPRAQFYPKAAISYYIAKDLPDSLSLNISDPNTSSTYRLKVPATAGIHRVYWDREFTPVPYTADEVAEAEEVLAKIVAANPHRRIKAAQLKFRESQDPEEQRKTLEKLTQGYLSYVIPKHLLMPRAGAGTYHLSLGNDGDVQTGTLSIRRDPGM